MTEYQEIDGRETVYRDGTIKLHGEEGFEGMRRAADLDIADLVGHSFGWLLAASRQQRRNDLISDKQAHTAVCKACDRHRRWL